MKNTKTTFNNLKKGEYYKFSYANYKICPVIYPPGPWKEIAHINSIRLDERSNVNILILSEKKKEIFIDDIVYFWDILCFWKENETLTGETFRATQEQLNCTIPFERIL